MIIHSYLIFEIRASVNLNNYFSNSLDAVIGFSKSEEDNNKNYEYCVI